MSSLSLSLLKKRLSDDKEEKEKRKKRERNREDLLPFSRGLSLFFALPASTFGDRKCALLNVSEGRKIRLRFFVAFFFF